MLFSEEDKAMFENGKLLPLIEDFYTIQGEGYHMGKAAYFIRLGGCDIGCSWCDTKFSWRQDLHQLTRADEIVLKAANYPAKAVVITGGEPLIYPLDYLTASLKNEGIATFLETSGAYELSGDWDWICLSPKKHMPPLRGIYSLARELKVIIQQADDIDWAIQVSGEVSHECKLYLQPEWSKHNEILPVIIDYVKKNPSWNISLQAHKFMNIP